MTLEPPPDEPLRDKVAAVVGAALGEVPFAGTLVELWRQWMPTQYEQRWAAWIRKLHELVLELETRQVSIEERIRERPGFVTAVHDATRIALGEHLEAKLDMLKAVLLSSALSDGDRLADITTLRFLRLVDELEPEHVLLLKRCGRHAGRFRVGDRTVTIAGSDENLAEVEALDAEIDKIHDHVTLLRDLEGLQLVERKPPSRYPEAIPLRDGGVELDLGGIFEMWEDPSTNNLDLTELGHEFLNWLNVV